ncbi:MAG TPA: T9SS type B sorting domain-containing protein, partial [Flavobacterium sp.]|nr:T9SS type B sorting domain-containing protein [Flavobacterium sp.]
TVTIIDEPVAYAPPASLTKVCDEDGTNDGIVNFDLLTLNASVLGIRSGGEFAVTYYESMADALAGINAITSTQLITVYVKVGNELAENCFNVRAVNLTIHKLPEPTPTDGIICFDTETQTLLNPYTIHSGLSPVSHTFIWHDQNGNIVGHQASYTAVTPGLYTVTAINNATGCASNPVDVIVTPSEPALVTYTISPDFASSQSITVIATGTGDYEYMLDNGVWQDSNVFENVSSGMHIVTVRDKNGCGQVSSSALVINYPHFFTPNGDGYNDTWNINDLAGHENAKINIFDRYGKYLKTIEPGKSGWDGTYNGRVMPSTDYWFVVNYEDQGMPMEFKAHFSMKR